MSGRVFIALGFALAVLGSHRGVARAQSLGDALKPQAVAAGAEKQKASYDAELARYTAAKRGVASLEASYRTQTTEVERLKKQRSSWRRDRELERALASSLETAKKLEVAQRASSAQKRAVERARAQLDAAIGRELPGASAAERERLMAWRAGITVPASRPKIVLPNLAIDPTADPEDLWEQAAEIRQTEVALAREIELLDRQARRWEDMAALRDIQQRSSRVASIQATDARRFSAATRRTASDSNPETPSPTPPPADPAPAEPSNGPELGDGNTAEGSVLSDVPAIALSFATVLGGVIDGDTKAALQASEASSDPSVRAKAAGAARKAAAAQLERLRKQRVLIEQRAIKNQ